MNAVLGGGMSSRLFQEVREQRGLAYSVYSFVQAFADTGYFGVYTGTMPSKLGQSVEVIKDTLIDISKSGLTETEITRGKGQLRGGFVLGMEDTGARMTRIAKAELVSGELPSVDQALDAIDSVTPDEIKEVSKLILGQKPTIAVVGPYQNQKVFRAAMRGN
jgi:predicted Zn-dependent peptidase